MKNYLYIIYTLCYTAYTGYTQKNSEVSIVFTFETALFFCVCPVYIYLLFQSQCTIALNVWFYSFVDVYIVIL
jgi:hypothetical protein